MKSWHFIVDLEKCEDCNNCFLACRDEHVDNEWPGYSLPQPRHGHRWINIMRKERGQYPLIDITYLPKLCMHCGDAPCIKAAKGAVYKRNDGIVIIDPDKAKGQKELTKSCPYGMIWWNKEQEVPQKCTFCAHLIDEGWKKTRCVQACPTGALQVEYLENVEMNRMVESEKLEVMAPEYNTQPSVYFKNIHLYTKCFISGSIALENDGQVDCVAGAKVTLFNDGEKIDEAITDNFGDFKLEGLSENSGKYLLEILSEGCAKKSIEVDLKTSLNVGTISLQPSS